MITSPSPETDDAWLARDPIALHSQTRPSRVAVTELASGRTWTYAALEEEVRRADALLRTLTGLRGARVALLARNGAHHPVLFYAAARAGVALIPLNWRLAGAELAIIVQDAQPAVFIYEAEFEAQALEALQQAPGAKVLRIGPEDDDLAAALARQTPAPPQPIDPLAPAMLLYTSGTTGRPKGVIITPKSAFFAAMNFAYTHDFCAQHAQLCDVPLFHVVGALAVMHGSLLGGARLYITDRFEPGATLGWLGDPGLGISHYFCVPQIAKALANYPDFATTNLKGLAIMTGGAPMPASLTVRLAEAGLLPANGYGMTEAGTVLGMPLDPSFAVRKAGAAGFLAPAIELQLVGADGRDAPPGTVGEIWLRGPAIACGYWNQPQATASAFVDGWFRTGDAARKDEDGVYFIVDRWKDMYISGGENVYPAEVEAAIAAIGQVADVAVVGVPDARWGEVGCAYVVRRDGGDLTADAILAVCRDRLARYKHPAHVCFVDGLPLTPSGKVQKDALRRLFAETAV